VILLVVLDDLVQQGITRSDESVTGTLIVISTISLLSVAVSWVSFRSGRVRLVTEDEPIILVQDGNIIERNLCRERLTRGDLEEEARRQQVDSPGDIRWAILEKEGSISVIKKYRVARRKQPLGARASVTIQEVLAKLAHAPPLPPSGATRLTPSGWRHPAAAESGFQSEDTLRCALRSGVWFGDVGEGDVDRVDGGAGEAG
jgi:Protein of unknown function (DUF421)